MTLSTHKDGCRFSTRNESLSQSKRWKLDQKWKIPKYKFLFFGSDQVLIKTELLTNYRPK